MKKIQKIYNLIEDKNFRTKAYLYFSTKTEGADFDPYEANYTTSNLNPIFVKGYMKQLSATSLVWKNYVLKEQGAIEFLCREKYRNWFENCNKIMINEEEYEVFKEGTGGKSIITNRPYNVIKVVLQRK